MSETIPLEEIASLPTFHHPAASPTGDHVAVYYDETGRNELHLIDVDTGDLTRVSDGDVPRNARWPFLWGPEGEELLYHLDENGDEQHDIYAIDLDGEVEPVIEREGQTILFDVGPGGRWLLFGSDAGEQMNLYRYDRREDAVERLTEYDFPVWTATFGPNAERVAYVANESEDYDNRDVYVMDADGSSERNLEIGEVGAEAGVADVSPDGTELLISDNTADKTRVGIYDLPTDEIEWLSDGEHVEEPVAFTPDGDRVLALRTRRAAVVPLVYGRDEESREFDLPEGVAAFPRYGDAAVLAADEVIVEQTTPTQRSALYRYDLETGEFRTLLESEYGSIAPDAFVEPEYFRFESHGVDGQRPSARETESPGGLEIGAIFYDSGERPSPAIVNPHGGPAGQDRLEFNYRVQYLVNRGYSVLQVNYRGSTGRGREFKNLINEDWGGGEQGDIAEGATWLADREWIDEDRIAVFGGSYGGYSAYWQMVRYPELYAAGIAWVGLTDLELMYEESMPHFRVGLMEKYLGTPEENPDLYRERSPITHAENLSAPLLMVHGVNDSRVPLSQAECFRDRLEELGYEEGETPEESRDGDEAAGGDFEYEELGEEGHGSSDIDQKIRSLRLVDDFLERRL